MSADGCQENLRVLIVDDHAIARRGIRAYLEVLPDVDPVGEAGDGAEALQLLVSFASRKSLPHVVLLDLLMPGMDGMTALKEIRSRYPGVRVVVLTSSGETGLLHTSMRWGASGYLLKDSGPREVGAALRAAVKDEVFIDTAMAKKLTQLVDSPSAGLAELTERERVVLGLVGEGRSNREIAKELYISERTARTHVSNILRKLRLGSRTQAALLAVRAGLAANENGTGAVGTGRMT